MLFSNTNLLVIILHRFNRAIIKCYYLFNDLCISIINFFLLNSTKAEL